MSVVAWPVSWGWGREQLDAAGLCLWVETGTRISSGCGAQESRARAAGTECPPGCWQGSLRPGRFSSRSQFFLQFPWSLWTLKLSCTVLVMGLMVPVSFSLYPQIGQVSPPSPATDRN